MGVVVDRHMLALRRLAILILTYGVFQLVFLSMRIPHTPTSTVHPNNNSSVSMVQEQHIRKNEQHDDDARTITEKAAATTTTTAETTHHAIPKILIFTHYKDLLHISPSDASSSSPQLNEEEQVLAANIRNSIDAHNFNVSQVRFLTDDDCILSLQNVYPSLIDFFLHETQGMYKADICRGSALLETGGIYLDVDVGVRHDLWSDLHPKTQFMTSLVHRQSHYPGHFFQAILGAERQSPVIRRYLQLFEKHYVATARGDTKSKDRIKKGPLGVILLKRAWDDVNNMYKKHNNRNDDPAADNGGDSSSLPLPSEPVKTELYQEVLYHPKVFPNLTPAPTWGTRRACHFVVVAKVNNHQNKEMELEVNKNKKNKGKTNASSIDIHIPLYSRIAGSRMCPRSNNNTTAPP